jgi:hypothetical protein
MKVNAVVAAPVLQVFLQCEAPAGEGKFVPGNFLFAEKLCI